MTKVTGHTGMVQYLSRKLIPLASGIALLIAFLAPVTFWLHSHNNIQQTTDIYAQELANKLQEIALESPALWKYQTYKFITITEGFHPTIVVSGFRVLDDKENLVTGRDYKKINWPKPGQKLSFAEEFKFTQGTAPIMFNDRQVGSIEILADDTPLLQTSTLLFCFSMLTGVALAVLIYRFPVMVVKKMAAEIEALIADLMQSDEKVRKLNMELEQKIEERTRELLNAQEALVRKEKLAILGQLSGSVGHELRNPLGVMSNAIYFLKMVLTEADDTTKEYLDIIKHEIDNSQRIITDLLDFARTKTPQTRAVTVRELVDKSIGKCILPDSVNLQTEIPDALPLLRIDELQMEQVFQNLITNAVQAMPGGGSVRISSTCWSEEQPGTGAFVAISVEDTGEGISPDNMSRLFQPLFTTKPKGIGLGLVVCRNLVEANGGRIEVKSESGKGTTFMVLLPVTEEGV